MFACSYFSDTVIVTLGFNQLLCALPAFSFAVVNLFSWSSQQKWSQRFVQLLLSSSECQCVCVHAACGQFHSDSMEMIVWQIVVFPNVFTTLWFHTYQM